ncbi:uncharacterized protein PFL1_00434 [Pseudozyma flocculosa PF-1]|uniref:Related to DUF1479 domain protein n=1 Tax=Pseudozyma flocculosa TaxID=84751 RepID=A0A5C3ESW5_9BASI|nr:uncharacterized protein PFL1_00434 [Pseudozyma flocculosa PF-1]EPQ32237.1 hypothetical protein PFL1_00434 [Pseudozyma flocculosa PF-1]SPO34815.1 related to DUF1479 domain protein [Pseudozyma flocculosa]
MLTTIISSRALTRAKSPAAVLARSLNTSSTQRAGAMGHHQAASSSVSASSSPPPPLRRPTQRAAPSTAGKKEGTIASVFATLSGGSLEAALPARFAELKRSMIRDEAHVQALKAAWLDVLTQLQGRVEETVERGGDLIPQIEYPTDAEAARQPIDKWTSPHTLEEVRQRGVAAIKGVVPAAQALQWKEDIQAYAKMNSARGFPESNPQVYELYWTRAQLAARGHPALMRTSQAFLSLFHAPSQSDDGSAFESVPPPELSVSLSNPLTYADRLRIRQPGDAQFALGPHVDGGGVERWECPTFRAVWDRILAGGRSWREHDPWSLGAAAERLGAQTDMYGGAGQCSVFRPLQGWLSMSSTRCNEGTLRVLPFLVESTAYIVLRPFFRPRRPADVAGPAYLLPDNWEFDGDSAHFPGCSLGHNIELSDRTHPHLRLDETMTSIPQVEPGDMVLWHCDGVHSVEAQHRGRGDSSVMYIPAIPTTKVNFDYVRRQRDAFERGIPPADFPGGEGESSFTGRGTPADVEGAMARRAMALEAFEMRDDMAEAERRLLAYCNGRV